METSIPSNQKNVVLSKIIVKIAREYYNNLKNFATPLSMLAIV